MNGNAKEFPLWFADPEQIKVRIAKLEQEKHELLKRNAETTAALAHIAALAKKGFQYDAAKLSIEVFEQLSK